MTHIGTWIGVCVNIGISMGVWAYIGVDMVGCGWGAMGVHVGVGGVDKARVGEVG